MMCERKITNPNGIELRQVGKGLSDRIEKTCAGHGYQPDRVMYLTPTNPVGINKGTDIYVCKDENDTYVLLTAFRMLNDTNQSVRTFDRLDYLSLAQYKDLYTKLREYDSLSFCFDYKETAEVSDSCPIFIGYKTGKLSYPLSKFLMLDTDAMLHGFLEVIRKVPAGEIKGWASIQDLTKQYSDIKQVINNHIQTNFRIFI